MRISEYPAYKPSGSKWLGDIPAHWKVSRLKYVAASNFSGVNKHTVDDETPVRLCNYVDVYYNDYITPDIAFMEATATQTEIARFTLKKGDVLVTKDSEAWDDIAIPAYVVSDLQGILCGYHLAHIRAAIGVFHGEYLFRAFSASGINDQFMVEATGITRYGLGKYGLDNSLFPLPPIEEQHAIAAFLNHETKRIDQLIIRKERQIELLQEKRSALISHAVTKGLNPKAKMKNSGIEWVGDIPEHWDAVPVKRQYEIQLGKMLQNNPSSESDISVSYIKALHVLWGEVDTSDLPDMWASPADLKQFRVKSGDLLVCEGGEAGRAGIVDSSPVTCIIQNALHRVREKGADVRYLQYVLQTVSSEGWFDVLCNKATIAHFTREKLANLRMPLPPSLEEQRAISSFLDRETARIDALVEKVRKSIELLREYRTALISAAVTGKIDVRKEAA